MRGADPGSPEEVKAALIAALEDDWAYWWGMAVGLHLGENEMAVFSRRAVMSAVKWYVRRDRPPCSAWERYMAAIEGSAPPRLAQAPGHRSLRGRDDAAGGAQVAPG